jgi:hypothetical protein
LFFQELKEKRKRQFEATTERIRDLFTRLETEPRNSQERHLVCDNTDTIVLSQDILDTAQRIQAGLEVEIENNTTVAKEILAKIRNIAEKLQNPDFIPSETYDFYSNRLLNEVSFSKIFQHSKKIY